MSPESDRKVLLAIQSYNRPHCLQLCLEFLQRTGLPDTVEVMVWDDGSPGLAVAEVLSEYRGRGVVHAQHFEGKREPAKTKAEADRRCGAQRRRIVHYFLSRPNLDRLVLLDDDVIVDGRSLAEALDDFDMLMEAGHRIGALTLHAWHSTHNERQIEGDVFAQVKITGESAVIFARHTFEMMQVRNAPGNPFGEQKGGYADTMWAAMRERNLLYFTRLKPPYRAQHLGIMDGSSIRRPEFDMPAFWLKDLWRNPAPGFPYLEVPGFDPEAYVRDVRTLGCERACLRLYLSLINEPEDTTVRSHGEAKDSIPEMHGKIRLNKLVRDPDGDITLPDGGRAKRVEVLVEKNNVFLNSSIKQVMRLLAGAGGQTVTGVDPTDLEIDRMQFGSGGSTDAAATDTGLVQPLPVIKDIEGWEFPDDFSVKFTAFLLDTELNGFPISEAALLFKNASPAAATRVTFDTQNKDENFIYEFQYTLFQTAQ